MSIPSYFDLLREAYEGELTGDTLYRGLSELSADVTHRRKLAAIADVERRTHGALRAVAFRLGIAPELEKIEANVARRTEELKRLPWTEFIDRAVANWPPYIERFETLQRMAPAIDAAAIRVLVDHERALVEFARLEQRQSAESLRPLETFLAASL